MPNPSVEFLFDFGSPNAYLCHKVLPDISRRTGVVIRYTPILLGGLFKLTNNRSPAQAYADIANKRAYQALETRRFITRHGLSDYRPNPHWPVNTLQLMRGAVAARELGLFEPYVDTVFKGMWERALNLGDPMVALEVLRAAALDGEAIQTLAQTDQVKQVLIDNTQLACDRGAFGAPTFFVNDEIFFGKDRLREVEEAITAAQA